jgi:hypothetical protein
MEIRVPAASSLNAFFFLLEEGGANLKASVCPLVY